MCLAIAPDNQSSNGRLSRLWRAVASTPLRLLSFAAAIHAVIMGALLVHGWVQGVAPDLLAYSFGFSFGILALVAFGQILSLLPKKFSLSPVHYLRYNAIYILMMTGLGILEVGILSQNHWVYVGMIVLVPAWLIALLSIGNLHAWIAFGMQARSRRLMRLLSANLAILVLSLAGQTYGSQMLAIVATSSSLLFVWPLVLFVSLDLVFSAPAKARVISP